LPAATLAIEILRGLTEVSERAMKVHVPALNWSIEQAPAVST
jgi:hypothetical protein